MRRYGKEGDEELLKMCEESKVWSYVCLEVIVESTGDDISFLVICFTK